MPSCWLVSPSPPSILSPAGEREREYGWRGAEFLDVIRNTVPLGSHVVRLFDRGAGASVHRLGGWALQLVPCSGIGYAISGTAITQTLVLVLHTVQRNHRPERAGSQAMG